MILEGDVMKEFNNEKFCADLLDLRGKESQADFALKLGINRSTLSLLENGKQIPTLDILSQICGMNQSSIDDYFQESVSDGLVYLMGSLDESDRAKIEKMITHIKIKEKYELLAKRGCYDNC